MSVNFIENDTEAAAAVQKSRQEEGLEPTRPRLQLVKAKDLIQDSKPGPYLVKGYLPAECTAWLYGGSGEGKTWVQGDLSARVAAGMSWGDRSTKQGPVVILAGEGLGSVKTRIAAWVQAHPGNDDLPLYVSNAGGTIDTLEGMEEVIAAVESVGESPVMIVIDTQARWMAGNESDTRDGGAYVRAVDALKDRFKCCVLTVHHTGKQGGDMRGSSAYRGAADVEMKITSQEKDESKTICLSVTKMKDGREPPPLFWELREMELQGWIDEDGDPISSAYLVQTDAPPDAGGRPKMIGPDDVKRVVMEYPHAGKNELSRLLAERCKTSTRTAGLRIDEQKGLGVLIEHTDRQKKTFTLAPGHEIDD